MCSQWSEGAWNGPQRADKELNKATVFIKPSKLSNFNKANLLRLLYGFD